MNEALGNRSTVPFYMYITPVNKFAVEILTEDATTVHGDQVSKFVLDSATVIKLFGRVMCKVRSLGHRGDEMTSPVRSF